MTGSKENVAKHRVLFASTINWPVASRMAIRFAQAGCQVAAVYPSKDHPLASTQAVADHYSFSMFHPQDSLLEAIQASGAEVVIPCDDLVVLYLHGLHAALPATPEGAATARVIERSLGDPGAYLLIGSRHEVQTAARSEGLNAAESFAIGKTTNLEALANTLPFPWVMKADHTWGGTGVRFVHNMAEARDFTRHAGAPPGILKVLKQLIVNRNHTAVGEWLHAMRSSLSVQRPVPGKPANTVAACWLGEALAMISVEVLATNGQTGPATKVRIIHNGQMEQTVRRMAARLGLSGFHGFDFMLDKESGLASLIEINSRCAPPCHLNAGPGQDPVDAFCRHWLGAPPEHAAPVHPGSIVAYFPQAWAADPTDPILSTGAHDIPAEDPQLVARIKDLALRDRRYLALKARLRGLVGGKKR